MRTINVGTGALTVPELSLGCMRIHTMAPAAIDALLRASLDVGITFFDHADIYGAGKSEEDPFGILAFSPPREAGREVLLADGSVQQVTETRFNEMLAEDFSDGVRALEDAAQCPDRSRLG